MLARVSLGVEVVVYTLMICSTSGLMFAAVTALGALGMGFNPSVQSLALTLYHRRGGKDSGKLFGAMSVVQAMWCVFCPPAFQRSASAELWGPLTSSVGCADAPAFLLCAARRCLGRSCTG